MTQYELTPSLLKLLEERDYKVTDPHSISHDELIKFYKLHKPVPSLLNLVKLTKIYYAPPPPAPAKTQEFTDLMARLRLEAKEKEYKALITPKSNYETLYEPVEAQSVAQMNKELKSNITTIINILVSVGSVIYAVWYWGGSSWGLEPGVKVLLCIGFGLLVLIAEVVVYMGYINKIEDARVKERSKKEVKKVVKRIL